MNEPVLDILFVLGGYFLGGIMFSDIFPRVFMKKDVKNLSDDKNPGASNVFKICGVPMGILCLFLDMAKGFLPVFLFMLLGGTESFVFSLVLISPVLGHAASPYYRFHGGKCIATAAGEAIALLPHTRVGLVIIASYLLFSLVIKLKTHRLRSIITFGIFGILALIANIIEGNIPTAVGCFVMSSIVVIKHLIKAEEKAGIEAEKIEETV